MSYRLLFLMLSVATVALAADPSGRKRVAIVIDDGPVPAQNASMLALLAREQVQVTFSHVGRNVVAHPGLAKNTAASGHEIANHSFTHPHLNVMSAAEVEQEVADTSVAIKAATGRAPAWFWAPYLEHDAHVDAAVKKATGLEHFPFNRYNFVSTSDWDASTTAEQFRQRATTGIVDGTIILMHEWPEVTLANLPWVITELKKQGVEFVTFSELAKQLPR